jgi:hypothetical protein
MGTAGRGGRQSEKRRRPREGLMCSYIPSREHSTTARVMGPPKIKLIRRAVASRLTHNPSSTLNSRVRLGDRVWPPKDRVTARAALDHQLNSRSCWHLQPTDVNECTQTVLHRREVEKYVCT